MKVITTKLKRLKKYTYIFLLITLIINTIEINTSKLESKYSNFAPQYEQPIIRPRGGHPGAPLEPVQGPIINNPHHNELLTPQFNHPMNNPVNSILDSPYVTPRVGANHPFPMAPPMGNNMILGNCPCAGSVRCPPCGMSPSMIPPPVHCPCAPKPHCARCPPLSLIHEIASKKALQDQKLASDLKGISTNITAIFKSISKYAGDVLKYELQAKSASQNMEESSLKAQFSRQEMVRTSEKARMIARNTLMHPCTVNCDSVPNEPGEIPHINPSSVLGNFIDDSKVFPEEVDSIGEFMKDTYSTNINGYNAHEREQDSVNQIENESEGQINIEPVGDSETQQDKVESVEKKQISPQEAQQFMGQQNRRMMLRRRRRN